MLRRFSTEMRVLALTGFLFLIGAEAFAQSIIIPHPVPDFRERMNACVGEWNTTRSDERGAMTYRQFTTKCLEGQKARPIRTVAACRNGTTAPATAPEGACAYDGGVDRWLD
ncbi:MAG TPA: hypothetical protein VGF62_04045 [Rhizomicrobium sp.]